MIRRWSPLGEPERLVELLILVAGTDQLAGCRAAREHVFTRWYPGGDRPAHSLAVVTASPAPELIVGVEAAAAAPCR